MARYKKDIIKADPGRKTVRGKPVKGNQGRGKSAKGKREHARQMKLKAGGPVGLLKRARKDSHWTKYMKTAKGKLWYKRLKAKRIKDRKKGKAA